MIHIKWFDYNEDFDDAYYGDQNGGLKVKEDEPWLSWNNDNGEMAYNKSKLNPRCIPLTFKALTDDCDIAFKFSGPTDDYEKTIEYSINGGSWNSITLGMSGNFSEEHYITLDNAGDTVSFVGDNPEYSIVDESSNEWIWKLCADSGQVEVYGNIMSLCNSTGFPYYYELDSSYEFYYFFSDSIAIVDASNLVLPSITVNEKSYYGMFGWCSYMIYPPKVLPATALSSECYYDMFLSCTRMIKAPEIQATQMDQYSCAYMFQSCRDLVEVQDQLNATLYDGCYNGMFSGCSSLITAPSLPSTNLRGSCYRYMFSGCSSLTTAPTLPATGMKNMCYYGMFQNCTSLEIAPVLPATTLADGSTYDVYCYTNMFSGCTSLRYVKCLAVTYIRSSTNTSNWLVNVAEDGLFILDEDAEWPGGSSGIPNGWDQDWV